ncbi:MAG: branched chain amino acid aminotransferase [Chloroflexota bacterium]|jgi:branched-chain amino acid aminotransferase|nr:aminotransferase class IV [Caldilinea sp.]GIK73921.1 MAG: branched chain amino acid aminotransferase [Chloroflexota bacterium]
MNSVNGHDYLYYVNGNFAPASQASLRLDDLGLVRGYGVFEVLRTYGVRPFGLRAHLERMQRSAAQIELDLPWSLAEIEAIVEETLARNDPTDVTIRIIATGGASSSFLMPEGRPSLLVMLAAVKPYPEEMYRRGATLITYDCPRFMPTVKSLNYITAIIGQRRAKAAGAIEALHCDAQGVISECTTSNFFIVRGDQLITPSVDVLPGVTRAAVLELAGDLFEIHERSIHRSELALAEEAFITSTTKEIMPIVRIDDQVIGDGAVGVHTQRLLHLFRSAVAQDPFPVLTHS